MQFAQRIDLLIGAIDSISKTANNASRLQESSKRAISSTHLLAVIVNEYLTNSNHICPFMEQECDFSSSLLDLILVRGGTTRDLLLNKSINDVDCVVDFNKTMKYHLNHLKKYHSTKQQQSKDCQCILFRYYLNKFANDIPRNSRISSNNSNFTYNFNILTNYCRDISNNRQLSNQIKQFKEKYQFFELMSNVIESNYLLNARFFIQIFLNSLLLKNKIEIKSKFFNQNWCVKINKSFIYNGIDLINTEFDFVDSLVPLGCVKELLDINKIVLQNNDNDNDNDNDNNNNNGLNIDDCKSNELLTYDDMPFFPMTMDRCYLCHDFTINAIFITFNDILNCNDFNWKYMIYATAIKNGNISQISDLHNKLLVAPSLKIINDESANFYFWRLIKTSSKYTNDIENGIWKIDDKLIKHTIKLYDSWFTKEYINDSPQRAATLIHKFLKWGIKDDTRIEDYRNRLKMFKLLKFDKRLIEAIDSNEGFKKHWRYGVHTNVVKNNQLKERVWDLFEEYGYNLRKQK